MKDPKISIITPSFNRKHLIEKLVESIRGQSYQNWELLIVDDDSSDGTVDYLTKLCKQEPRIIIAKRKSQIKGANPCRNEGLGKATGDYLMFLDSDDLLFPNCLEQRSKQAEKFDNYDFLVFNGVFGDTEGTPSDILWNVETNESHLGRFIKSDSVWSISGGLFKTSFLHERKILFDESLARHQDVDFHIQVLLNTSNYRSLLYMQPDYIVRRHGVASISQKTNADFSLSGAKIANKLSLIRDKYPEDFRYLIDAKLLFEINHLLLRKHFSKAFYYLKINKIMPTISFSLFLFWIYSLMHLKLRGRFPSNDLNINTWIKIIWHSKRKSNIGIHYCGDSLYQANGYFN